MTISNMIIPTIGSSGTYELKTPLNNLLVSNERYTCIAIRKISDFISNNEDIVSMAYTNIGLTVENYNNDSKEDMLILTLMSGKGHCVYIPASYVDKFPNTNGIPYKSFVIGISLPAMPVDKDYSNVYTSLSNIIKDTLGVIPVIKTVETSRVSLIDNSKHKLLDSQRKTVMDNNGTDRQRYLKTLSDLQKANEKIQALEAYILELNS